jgi:ribonuclease VapC
VILDSSAVLAILFREPGFEALFEKLAADPNPGIGSPTLAEAGIVLVARLGNASRSRLTSFLAESDMAIVPFGEAHWRAAVDAFQRFGKGRHPAGLNFGDCMSYATAKLADQPLLCSGSDFARTDLQLA